MGETLGALLLPRGTPVPSAPVALPAYALPLRWETVAQAEVDLAAMSEVERETFLAQIDWSGCDLATAWGTLGGGRTRWAGGAVTTVAEAS